MRSALMVLLLGCTHPPLPPVLSEDVCGVGTWGALIVDEDTIFVRADADPDGDGSEARPFNTMQAGADAAGARGGGLVAVAEGVYAEQVTLEQEHDGVHIAGRCSDRVVIDASGFVEGTWSIQSAIYASGTSGLTISGLTIQDAGVGVLVNNGQLVLEDSRITRSGGIGLVVSGISADMTTNRVLIDDAVPRNIEGMGYYGLGMLIQQGSLVASQITLDDNVRMGIYGLNSTISIADSTLSNTRPAEDGEYQAGPTGPTYNDNLGVGLFVVGDGDDMALKVENTLIQGNTQAGIYLNHTNASLTDVEIRDTWMDERHPHGGGMLITEESMVEATELHIEDNAWAGIVTSLGAEGTDSGPSTLILTDSEIRRTVPAPNGTLGIGLGAFVANVDAENVTVEHNYNTGIFGLASTLSLREVTVSGTLPYISTDNVSADELIESGFFSEEQVLDILTFIDTGSTGSNIALLNTTLSAEGLKITDSIHTGIFSINSDITLTDCTIKNDEHNEVIGSGILLSDTTFFADGLDISGFMGVGFLATDSTLLQIYDMTLTNIISSTYEFSGSEAVGPQEEIDGWGLYTRDSTLSLSDSTISHTSNRGLMLWGGEVSIENVTVTDTQRTGSQSLAFGVLVGGGAAVEATGLVTQHNDGIGLIALGNPEDLTTFDCATCTLSDNRFAGVLLEGAALSLSDSELHANTPHVNEVGAYGIMVAPANTATLTLQDSTIGPHQNAAIYIEDEQAAPGHYTLRRNHIAGRLLDASGYVTWPSGNVLFATGLTDERQLVATGNAFSHSDIGIFLHDATGTFTANTFTSTPTRLHAQACAADVSLPLLDFSKGTTLCPDWDKGVVLPDLSLTQEVGSVE